MFNWGFTSQNWNLPQIVTVTGVHDDLTDGDIEYTIITFAAISDDVYYNGLDPNNVSVTNKDHNLSITIGSIGDTIEVTDPNDALCGVFCEVPPGALDTDTTITIDKIDDPFAFPLGIQQVGNVLDFGPDGLSFDPNTKVTIGLPYPSSINPDRLIPLKYNSSISEWEEINIKEWSLDKEKKRVLIEISNFSIYALGQTQPIKESNGGNGGCFISTMPH